MEQKFQFESLVFWKGEGDSVCVVDEGGGAEVRLPAGVWERLATLSPAELTAVRDGVARLGDGLDRTLVSGPTDESAHEHDAEAPEERPDPLEAARIITPGPLLVDGREVEVPGVKVVTFKSDPTNVPPVTDGRARKPEETILGIVVHTVHGKRGPLRDGGKVSSRVFDYAKYQATTKRDVSWHLTVGTDGTVVQSADTSWMCWHAGHVNARTVGIEMVQDADGGLYKDQLAATVELLEALCRELGVPRRTPVRAGKPFGALLLPDDIFPGVYGHRNVWALKVGKKVAVRGLGDPGDWIFQALLDAGFQGVVV